MDFSKLSQNEKLAVYGAAAVIVGGLVGYSYGVTVLAVLAAIALLAVVLLPQLSAGTKLPGSRGSLMLLTGGVAGVVLVLAFVLYIGTIFTAFNIRDLFFLIAVAGGVVAAWAGWQEFQREGGKFQIGTAAAASAPPAAAAPPAAPAEPAQAPPPAPAPAPDAPSDMPASSMDDDDRPTA